MTVMADTLPDDPGTLKAMLLAERARVERLQQIIKELQRHRFGRRAETLPEDQLLLGLALQLHSPFEMGAARFGLMGSSPERPCDDLRGLDAPLCKLDDDAANFLDRPADQEHCFVRRRSIIFLGGDVILARCRMTAIMAKASMTSET